VVKNRAGLTDDKLRYAHDHAPISDFLTAIRTLRPTAIIGVAAVGGAFTPEVLRAMAELNERLPGRQLQMERLPRHHGIAVG
jgi:malate dehydrogenase (oxaloacetate-decarboxylating)(NADP+)